ncbi:NADH-quinone oxidoreductase subunit NuoH [Candidatus Chlorohelix sp.]|uniref:NADH-quinone oxidoreductase subunit NuoH n=1 Tax=Candidatus Chlorohelix sp. TaxID=3139201 RepID=UPI0030400935
MSWTDFLQFAIKAFILTAVLLGAFAYMTLFERKVIARMQNRYGPNRVGPFGTLQPIADGVKLVFKEHIVPKKAQRPLYDIAPMLSLIVAITAYAVIPLGPASLEIFGAKFWVADINIGILFILSISSLAVYGITLGGWSSGNKYSLMGAIRSTAQIISYELSLGLSLLGVIILASSLRMNDIVESQKTVWFVFLQVPAFIIYCIGAVAEVNRAPFDLPEAEQELVAGYHTEYGGMRFAMYFAAEYINMVTVSSIATTMFLGGWQPPLWFLPVELGPLWFVLKVLLFLFGFVWLRATLPRLKYDRLMQVGWKWLLPLAVLNLVITSIVVALVS